MFEPTYPRTLEHRNAAFVIFSSGDAETLTVVGQPISSTMSDNDRYQTIHLPHAQYHDLETTARPHRATPVSGGKAGYAGITAPEEARYRCAS